jgi:hypothetical protein
VINIPSLGFEYASQPGITDEEKANRLHFAVVGGGPTVRVFINFANATTLRC